jgi:pimeloyl-ACP methyl ester carboxylesterase
MSMNVTPLILVVATFVAAGPASAETRAPLVWTHCGASATSVTDVATRTECARLIVPRDYANAEAGTLDLDLVRVTASGARGEPHGGALLVEPDNFSEAIQQAVPGLAAAWLRGDEGWRELARRIDIVGLAPRRMDTASGHDCVSATAQVARFASLGTDQSFTNLMKAEDLARAIATACQNDPMQAHIGTRLRVQDMERLREALGESTLHLLGIGHGGWVAARYAERYPQHVGRMVLDGSWDADGSVAEAMEARIHERGRTVRRAINALVDRPDRYGWGDDAAVVTTSLSALPSRVYSAWIRQIVSAEDLSAVLSMGRLLENDASLSVEALRRALSSVPLAPRDDDDLTVRGAAERLLVSFDANAADGSLGFGPEASHAAPSLIASVFAGQCNDGSWGSGPSYWQGRTRDLRLSWPAGVDNETFLGMVCSEWRGTLPYTSVPMLDNAPPFLMVHAEFDEQAPLRNAAMMLQAHGNARMVVARGLRAHGVFARADRPCVAEVARRFLAEGELPDGKLTNCNLPLPTE